jgi:flavorubredoxin
MQATEVKDGVYWVGAIDWDVRDFHGYLTQLGSTYNAYLVRDKKTVLFDTVKKGFLDDLVHHISQVTNPGDIDYIVVSHVEMDHSGSLPEAIDLVRPEKVFCSANGKKALLAHYHRDDWPLEVVANGDKLDLGERTVQFFETKMLHWPDSMMSYIDGQNLLISQDGFGQHWATSERFDDEVDVAQLYYQTKWYYANIILPYSNFVQKLLQTVKEGGLSIDIIAPDHGLIWRRDVSTVIDLYDKWSRQVTCAKAVVVFDTMWESTAKMAHAVAEGIQKQGVGVKVMNLHSVHRSDVIAELQDSRALVVGSCTLNNGMMPRMADLLTYLKGLRPAGKIGAAFGSYGWGGEAVKLINTSLQEMNVELLDEGLRVNYVPTETDLAQCTGLGEKIGSAVREQVACELPSQPVAR